MIDTLGEIITRNEGRDDTDKATGIDFEKESNKKLW